MRTKHLWIASSVCMLLVGAVAWATAASAATSRSRRLPPRDEISRISPTRAIIEYANRVRVEKPERHGNLSLFAVSVSGVKVPDIHLTLNQALKQGRFEAIELDEPDVNRLKVRNWGKEPVFIIAGEMLRGGKQDRIAGDDLIVLEQTKLVIPVFCVEHGRWAGRESGFSVGHSLAGARVRQSAGRGGGQGAVWSRVEEQQKALDAPSATGALRSVHDSKAVRDRMKPYLRALSDLPDEHRKAVGIVAVVGGEIIAADLFSSRKLFETMWPDLLEAYVVDALEHAEVQPMLRHREEKGAALGEKDVLRWLQGLRSAEMSVKDTPGDGELYELSGRGLSGTALVYEHGIVHIALFPNDVIARPDYNSLEFRRERVR